MVSNLMQQSTSLEPRLYSDILEQQHKQWRPYGVACPYNDTPMPWLLSSAEISAFSLIGPARMAAFACLSTSPPYMHSISAGQQKHFRLHCSN